MDNMAGGLHVIVTPKRRGSVETRAPFHAMRDLMCNLWDIVSGLYVSRAPINTSG